MFGGLKKRLKEAVGKISGSISKETEKEEQLFQETVPEIHEPVKHVEHKHVEHKHAEHRPEKEEVFIQVEKAPAEIDMTAAAEIKKEAELIVEEEAVSDAIKKGLREEEREKFSEEVDEVLEETREKKDLLELKEESKLLIDSETFQEVIAEDVKEKEKDAKIEARKIIEETETAQVREAEELQDVEKDLKKIQREIRMEAKPEPVKLSFMQRIKGKTLSQNDFDEMSSELSIALLENDVSVEVKDRIMDELKKELVGTFVSRGKAEEVIINALKHAIISVMSQERLNLNEKIENHQGPFVIMVVGFNGVGKTTTIAKLAHKLKDYNPVLAAGDTFRAASIEQIEEHGRRLGVRVIKHNYGSDSAAVIFDARKHAEASGNRVVLADTAGRSHSNVNLMDELKKIARVNHPDMKILVLDSITGNDIYDQCKLFNDAVGVDAIILTKADVYERGGAALSAAYTLKKPILFLGVGQEYSDLKEFRAEEIAETLLE